MLKRWLGTLRQDPSRCFTTDSNSRYSGARTELRFFTKYLRKKPQYVIIVYLRGIRQKGRGHGMNEDRHLSRMLKEEREYIIPVRFDNTPIPGLPDTILYQNASDYSPAETISDDCKKTRNYRF